MFFKLSLLFYIRLFCAREIQVILETESVSEGLGSSEDIVCSFDFDGKNKVFHKFVEMLVRFCKKNNIYDM